MNEPTKKQEEALREFLHSGVVPLIEDVLVKKLGQAMSYAKEQLDTSKREWVGLTDDEIDSIFVDYGWCISTLYLRVVRSIEAKLKEKNT